MRSPLNSIAFSFVGSLVGSLVFLGVSVTAQAEEADPNHGNFTLAEATKGIPGPAAGHLQATIETSKGKFTCELFEKQTPVTVANFVGLATGKRAWLDPKTGKWVQKKPLYDGLIFHRVIPGFMIQGGDPLGTGTGNPGYRFQDEIVPELRFDKPALLAMANAGPATNGSQFFITEGTPEHLTGRHTIFGACEPVALVGGDHARQDRTARSPGRGRGDQEDHHRPRQARQGGGGRQGHQRRPRRPATRRWTRPPTRRPNPPTPRSRSRSVKKLPRRLRPPRPRSASLLPLSLHAPSRAGQGTTACALAPAARDLLETLRPRHQHPPS